MMPTAVMQTQPAAPAGPHYIIFHPAAPRTLASAPPLVTISRTDSSHAMPTLPRADVSPDADITEEVLEETRTRKKPKKPRRWRVILHNDDYTSMEFVVEILIAHFGKGHAEAVHVMLQVHHNGRGVAGVYPKEVAETKVAEVTAEARAQGMPLLLTLEPVEEDGG